MRQCIFISLFACMLLGCRNDLNIDPNGISHIKLISVNDSSAGEIQDVTDRKLIQRVIYCMNHAHKEPIYFYERYKGIFYTKDGSFDIGLNGNSMKTNKGATYQLSCDLVNLITSSHTQDSSAQVKPDTLRIDRDKQHWSIKTDTIIRKGKQRCLLAELYPDSIAESRLGFSILWVE